MLKICQNNCKVQASIIDSRSPKTLVLHLHEPLDLYKNTINTEEHAAGDQSPEKKNGGKVAALD